MRYTFILLLSFISFKSNAQTKFSIQAGTVSTNNYIKNPFQNPPVFVPSFNNYLSFDLGVIMNHVIYKKVISESGIFYNQKGYQFYSKPIPDYTSYGYNHINYLVLNQNFSYRFLNFKNIFLATGIGGFLGRGVSGKYKEDTYNFGAHQYSEGKIRFGNTTKDQFQSWDAGLNFLLRAGYKKFDVTAMFSPSLTNHIPKASQQNMEENLASVSINLGYNF